MPVAESVLAPPGPIPNPVVTQRSAGEYCGGDSTGGEAAAGAPHPRSDPFGRGMGGTHPETHRAMRRVTREQARTRATR